MSLKVQRLAGSPAEIPYESAMTIAQLKEELASRWDTPAYELNILFKHRYMHDEAPLAECDLKAGDTVYSTLKLASGMPISVEDVGAIFTVLVVPYDHISSIIEKLQLTPERYVVCDVNNGIIPNDEFCAHVLKTLRAGVKIRPIFT